MVLIDLASRSFQKSSAAAGSREGEMPATHEAEMDSEELVITVKLDVAPTEVSIENSAVLLLCTGEHTTRLKLPAVLFDEESVQCSWDRGPEILTVKIPRIDCEDTAEQSLELDIAESASPLATAAAEATEEGIDSLVAENADVIRSVDPAFRVKPLKANSGLLLVQLAGRGKG